MRSARDMDLEMFQNPASWPNRPLLPIKRYTDKGLECALLMELPTKALCLAHANLWDDRDALAATLVTSISNLVTVEDILDAGWEVD